MLAPMRTDITRARKRARLTQAQVAKAIGKTQSEVSRFESGERPVPVEAAPRLEHRLQRKVRRT